MTSTSTGRPETSIDLSDPDVNRDPFPYFEQIRALGPAVWSDPAGGWLVSSFGDVKSIFANFKEFAQDADMFADIHGAVTLPGLDNPRHNEVRGIVGPLMSRTAAEKHADLAQEVINTHLGPVIDRLRAGETVDVARVYRAISTHFVSRTLGVPVEDADQFVAWADDMIRVFDLTFTPDLEDAEQIRAAAAAATAAMNDYATAAIDERRRTGQTGDLLGALATTDVELTDKERNAYVTMIIQGGQDTTATWAKNLTVALGAHSDQRRIVQQDRELVRQTLDEVMRWQAPVTAEVRIVRTEGVDIGGVPVAQGDHVVMLLGAAHRDPTRWENPEKFDILRPAMGNLGLGFGIHGCLGVNFARRVLTSITNTLLDEIPEYTLAIPLSELDYGRSYSVRGPVSLPITL